MAPARSAPDLRGLLCGSGAGLAAPGMAELVVELVGREAAAIEVLYLGTATYDRAEARERQTGRLAELGCTVATLDVALESPPAEVIEEHIARADVLAVSGGNTLYAVDRWVALRLDELVRQAIDRGLVIGGGSAGAICWFDGGHSDSMDPTTYLQPVPATDPRARRWRYIRVAGLGVLPGLLCPHYGATQSNGVLRATDFEAMMLQHPGETGLGLDDWAGLLVEGATYRVVHPVGRTGSAGPAGFVSDGSGRPGLWLHEVVDGAVESELAPRQGRLAEILRPARAVVDDPHLPSAREENRPPLR